MSTRDEILAALTDAKDGLTAKELAVHCPSADCDEIIVARMLGAMRTENVVHIDGFRLGANVWKFGKNPNAEEPPEPKVTLAGFVPPQPRTAGEAARAIAEARKAAAMAKPITRSPAPTPAATPATPKPQDAPPKEGADMTIREKIEKVLKEYGPLTTREMRKHGLKDATVSQHCLDLTKRKIIVVLGGGKRSKIYGLPGQKMADRDEPSERVDRPTLPRVEVPRKLAKAKKGLREKPRRPAAPPEPATPPSNGAAQFAINEHGELGIEVEQTKVRLGPDEFGRLREFIEKTKPVWEGAGA